VKELFAESEVGKSEVDEREVGKGDLFEGRSLICLKGELCLGQSAELKRELMDALERADGLLVDLSESTAIDITGIQILWALWLRAERLGKSCELLEPLPEPLLDTLRLAGFNGLPLPLYERHTATETMVSR
jgi:anti-anti-sigma regulatory factor